MKRSKQVTSYWIKKFPNGIYQLLFNTMDRWVSYHQYNNTTYLIGCSMDENEQPIYDNIQEIPEGLIPQNEKFQVLTQQEKDQISFYFIPTSMVFRNGEEIIFQKRYEEEEINN